MTNDELVTIVEEVLDTLVEVGNGTSDKDLHEACDKLFAARDKINQNIDNVVTLSKRQEDLLLLVRKLSATTPYQEEIEGWLAQRGAMMAEIGTLKASIKELGLERDMWKRRAAQHGCNIENGDHECG